MSGIVFFATNELESIREFYTERLGCELWRDQGDCLIFSHGNLQIGFCDRDRIDTSGMICFVYDSREEVDEMHSALGGIATSEPRLNDKYAIYHFFAEDPEGRALEFQVFE